MDLTIEAGPGTVLWRLMQPVSLVGGIALAIFLGFGAPELLNGTPNSRHESMTSSASPGQGDGRTVSDPDAGLDLFYNPTPGVRANLTVNTDFAQTEVDQRQVNLTRFSLFFPERRDFFLDGAIFFDFASDSGSGPQVQPFFSRRIGLSADATPQKIDFGTKFTGQMGGQDVGFLHVRTGDEEGRFPGEDFTVARVKRRILQQSYFGALYTRRDARDGDAAGTSHTSGVDFRVATSQFRGTQNLSATAWLLRATVISGKLSHLMAFGSYASFTPRFLESEPLRPPTA